MVSYYKIVQLFNNLCLAHPNVAKFTVNEVEDFDLAKQTAYPLAHLITNNVTINDGIMRYSVTLIVADKVVNITQDSVGEYNVLNRDFRGLDNTLDVINSCEGVVLDVFSYIQRNSKAASFKISLDTVITPFVEKGDNLLAGVSADLIIDSYLDVNSCMLLVNDITGDGGSDDCCKNPVFHDFNHILVESGGHLLQEDTSYLNWK